MEYAKIKIHMDDDNIDMNTIARNNLSFVANDSVLISRSQIDENSKNNLLSKPHKPNIMAGDCSQKSCTNIKDLKISCDRINEYGDLKETESPFTETLTEYFDNKYTKLLPILEIYQKCRTKPSIFDDSQLKFRSNLIESPLQMENQTLFYSDLYHNFLRENKNKCCQEKFSNEPKSFFIEDNSIIVKVSQKKYLTSENLTHSKNLKNLYFEYLFDSSYLYVMAHKLISDEKAANIKVMLNNLLKEIDKTFNSPKRQEKPLKPKKTPVSNNTTEYIVKAIPKFPFNLDLQNVQSISEIIKLCTNLSSTENKYSTNSSSTNSPKFLAQSKINKPITKFDISKTNELMMPYSLNLNPNIHVKIFVLSPFDEMIKSHSSASDRRLRAIANRMNCKIDIHGPFKASHFTSSYSTTHEKVTYHCVISSEFESKLDKCHKCIKDTFPTTTIREISITQLSAHS